LLVVVGGVVFPDTLDLSLVQVAPPSIGTALRLPEGPPQRPRSLPPQAARSWLATL
jgi:hypothetical protein